MTDPDAAQPPTLPRVRPWMWVVLAAICLAGGFFRALALDQLQIRDLDEAYHAIVARSMIEHPLRPTLYETPYLPFDYRNWTGNQVWLHKPPVALWQMAASMAFFGESNLTMRLPSLPLSAASVVLTFLIGRRLGDAGAGLVAAAFQSFCPALTLLVQGKVFSDHIDVALLFYCQLSVLLLLIGAQSGRTGPVLLAGMFMGVGWLTKSFPATFVLGLAGALWLMPRWNVSSPWPMRLSAKQVALFAASAFVVCIPWVAWCLWRYPNEFLYEQVFVFRHLTEDIETFGHPWDRLVFDYLVRVFLEWYPLVFVSFFLIGIDAIRRRDACRLFVFLWALGVLIPHLLATTKTPSATLIGWPALWLSAGFIVSDALRGRLIALAVVIVSAVAAFGAPVRVPVLDRSQVTGFASIMLSQPRVLWEVGLVALAAGIVALSRRPPLPTRRVPIAIAMALLLALPAARHVQLSYRTGADRVKQPVAFPKTGPFVREKAPPDAVFFVENLSRSEHIIAMWWLDRACYPLVPERFEADLAYVRQRGGLPFILSRGPRPEPVLWSAPGEATIYRLDQPPAGKN